MGILVFILSIIAAVLLMLVILIQNPKGGGIDSSFGAANQLGSVQKTNDVVEKATWYLAIFIVILALSYSLIISNDTPSEVVTDSKLDTSFTPAVNPNAVELPNNNPQGNNQ